MSVPLAVRVLLMTLSEFIEQSNEATTVEELYRLLEAVMQSECGYDRVIFSLMSNHDSLGLPAGHGLMRNYPDDWMRHYIERGYEQVDPVRRFGFRHVGPFLWDTIPVVMDLSPQQHLCLNQGRDAGLHNGAAVCLRGLMGEFAGVAGASSQRDVLPSEKAARRHLAVLNAISHQFYVAFCGLHQRRFDIHKMRVILTRKELDVLRLIAMSKSDGVIAELLQTSPHTVNFHVRKILKKFNVSDRIGLIKAVLDSGILAPEETVFPRVEATGIG